MAKYHIPEGITAEYADLLIEHGEDYIGEEESASEVLSMDSFDEFYEDASPKSVALSVFFGGDFGLLKDHDCGKVGAFNPNRDLFYVDGYGNPMSLDERYLIDYLNWSIDESCFLDWCEEKGYINYDEEN